MPERRRTDCGQRASGRSSATSPASTADAGIRFYEFLLQVSCFEDVDLHKKYNFIEDFKPIPESKLARRFKEILSPSTSYMKKRDEEFSKLQEYFEFYLRATQLLAWSHSVVGIPTAQRSYLIKVYPSCASPILGMLGRWIIYTLETAWMTLLSSISTVSAGRKGSMLG